MTDQEIARRMSALIEIQKRSTDTDYMVGMYNGMILMMSLVDGSKPEFLNPPSIIKDKEKPVREPSKKVSQRS